MLTMEEIEKHKALAMKTKKNLRRSKKESLVLSKIGLIGYCDNTVELCDTIIRISKNVPK